MAEHVTHSHQAAEHEEHGSGAYWLVWIALVGLTALTWWTGQMDITGFNLLVALVIAITKATLVVLFFMHLWEQKGVNRIAFVTSLVTVGVMMLGIFSDIVTRLDTLLPERETPGAIPHQQHGGTPPPPGGTKPEGSGSGH